MGSSFFVAVTHFMHLSPSIAFCCLSPTTHLDTNRSAFPPSLVLHLTQPTTHHPPLTIHHSSTTLKQSSTHPNPQCASTPSTTTPAAAKNLVPFWRGTAKPITMTTTTTSILHAAADTPSDHADCLISLNTL